MSWKCKIFTLSSGFLMSWLSCRHILLPSNFPVWCMLLLVPVCFSNIPCSSVFLILVVWATAITCMQNIHRTIIKRNFFVFFPCTPEGCHVQSLGFVNTPQRDTGHDDFQYTKHNSPTNVFWPATTALILSWSFHLKLLRTNCDFKRIIFCEIAIALICRFDARISSEEEFCDLSQWEVSKPPGSNLIAVVFWWKTQIYQ